MSGYQNVLQLYFVFTLSLLCSMIWAISLAQINVMADLPPSMITRMKGMHVDTESGTSECYEAREILSNCWEILPRSEGRREGRWEGWQEGRWENLVALSQALKICTPSDSQMRKLLLKNCAIYSLFRLVWPNTEEPQGKVDKKNRKKKLTNVSFGLTYIHTT